VKRESRIQMEEAKHDGNAPLLAPLFFVSAVSSCLCVCVCGCVCVCLTDRVCVLMCVSWLFTLASSCSLSPPPPCHSPQHRSWFYFSHSFFTFHLPSVRRTHLMHTNQYTHAHKHSQTQTCTSGTHILSHTDSIRYEHSLVLSLSLPLSLLLALAYIHTHAQKIAPSLTHTHTHKGSRMCDLQYPGMC
jgi:hypothetical protein